MTFVSFWLVLYEIVIDNSVDHILERRWSDPAKGIVRWLRCRLEFTKESSRTHVLTGGLDCRGHYWQYLFERRGRMLIHRGHGIFAGSQSVLGRKLWSLRSSSTIFELFQWLKDIFSFLHSCCNLLSVALDLSIWSVYRSRIRCELFYYLPSFSLISLHSYLVVKMVPISFQRPAPYIRSPLRKSNRSVSDQGPLLKGPCSLRLRRGRTKLL